MYEKLIVQVICDKEIGTAFYVAPDLLLTAWHTVESFKNDGNNVVKAVGGDLKFVVDKIYENADVILIPSIMADPFPTTVLEAMLFSKPLISTNHGGASEIIDDNFGKLISPNDTDAFVNAIRYFIKNISCLCEFGKNARKKYENYHQQRNGQLQ